MQTPIYLKHKHSLIFYKIVEDVIVVVAPSSKSLLFVYSVNKIEVDKVLAEQHTPISKNEFDAASDAAILTMIEISTL